MRASVSVPELDTELLLMINKEADGSWCLLSVFACGEANADPAASIMCRSRPSSIEPWSG